MLGIGGWQGKVGIWYFAESSSLELPGIYAHPDSVQVAFSPKGQFVYGSGGVAVLWDVNTQKELRRYTFPAQGLTALAFSNDEAMLATANWAGARSGPGAVRIFDLTTNVERIIATDGGVSVSFHPDNKRLAFAKGGWNSTIEVYDIQAEKRYSSPYHGTIASGLAISSDSKLMAHGASRGIIKVIEIDTSSEKCRLQRQEYDPRSAEGAPMAFYPGQDSLVFTGFDRGTKFYSWNLNSNQVNPFMPDERFISTYLWPSVCISADRRVLAIGDRTELEHLETQILAVQQSIIFDLVVTR